MSTWRKVDHLSFQGTWREGWVMYDNTIVVFTGDVYTSNTRKGK